MKFIVTLFLISINLSLFAQDTIRTQDLTSAGQTYVLSTCSAYTGFDPISTGANFNWNFAQLGRTGQTIDTILDINSTNTLFSFYFINSPLNSNRSNQATSGQSFQLGTVGLSDVFNYYYNSSAEFTQVGFGAVVNGVPLPIAYSPHDVIYKFPLKYGDADSVAFGYGVDLTTTLGLYFRVSKTRKNVVDGWGSLTTPYGTFDVLRIKSTIVERDSVHIDSLNFGFNGPPITTKEYKWLGHGFGMPLLQVNTSANDNITQILYQDSLHLSGINEPGGFANEPVVFPNPSSKYLFVRYDLKNKGETIVRLFSVDGKEVYNKQENHNCAGENVSVIDLNALNLSEGNYFLKLENGSSVFTKQVQISR